MKNWLRLLISISLPLLTGFTGSLFTKTGPGTWYQQISKPAWNPPGWIFGPVWTTLYILMGIAFYLVWTSRASENVKRKAMILWVAQLVLNFTWSFLFFDQHLIGAALIDIVLLWILILLCIFAFARVSKLAAWLLVPYICWVSFAALLNGEIWRIN